MTWVQAFNWILIVLTLLTTVWAIYERIASSKDRADIKASIRNWQHQAKGISSAIQRLIHSSMADDGDNIWRSFTSKVDVGIALDALHKTTESMEQSLYESRFFTESELKEILKKEQQPTQDQQEI